MEESLDIRKVQEVSKDRANLWHNGDFKEWSGLEWAGAMCGEAGEAANIAKKLKRIENNLWGNAFSDRSKNTENAYEELRAELAEECADIFLYLCLLASRYDIDLANAVKYKFNKKSEQAGFPQRV